MKFTTLLILSASVAIANQVSDLVFEEMEEEFSIKELIEQSVKPKNSCYSVKFCREFMESKQTANATTPYAASNFVVTANNSITANLTNTTPND
jgi:chromosomal replication initiation ATPase DnaA